LLTSELLPVLQKTKLSRVVNVSSMVVKDEGMLKRGLRLDDMNFETGNWEMTGIVAYATSKLYETLFSWTFKKFLEKSRGTRVKCVSLHPGAISTNLSQDLPKWMQGFWSVIILIFLPIFKDIEYGAATSMHCATIDYEKLADGEYYADLVVKTDLINKKHLTEENGKALWNKTVDLLEDRVGMKLNLQKF
jgi:NAD(P)-dependent dehydrogenase (short-subunit alcohol dehydrogenase family)